jgi:hypothetical protein
LLAGCKAASSEQNKCGPDQGRIHHGDVPKITP